MSTRYLVLAAISFLAISLVATLVRSADETTAADKKQPSMEEMMAVWAKYGTPGKEHEIFKTMAGKFDADVTMQMPGAPQPEKSTGTLENRLLFEGRYMHGDYNGSFMGKPFKGHGLWAFDKFKSKYMCLWIDDMSTMVTISEGTADSTGKVITVSGKCPDPMSGKELTMRQVLTVVDDDHHTYESYQTGEDGKEIKCVTIKYTRAK